jgi:hypothetical protein
MKQTNRVRLRCAPPALQSPNDIQRRFRCPWTAVFSSRRRVPNHRISNRGRRCRAPTALSLSHFSLQVLDFLNRRTPLPEDLTCPCRIPDTVVLNFSSRSAPAWYFTGREGFILRKNRCEESCDVRFVLQITHVPSQDQLQQQYHPARLSARRQEAPM